MTQELENLAQLACDEDETNRELAKQLLLGCAVDDRKIYARVYLRAVFSQGIKHAMEEKWRLDEFRFHIKGEAWWSVNTTFQKEINRLFVDINHGFVTYSTIFVPEYFEHLYKTWQTMTSDIFVSTYVYRMICKALGGFLLEKLYFPAIENNLQKLTQLIYQ